MNEKLKIEHDEDADSPRTWDNTGTLLVAHGRHAFGDVNFSSMESVLDYWRALEEEHGSDNLIRLPVYLYDHSGLTISTSPFSCPWDSGQIGEIWALKGHEGMTDERIRECLEGEIEAMDQFLRGEVYRYTVEDADGELIDSCGGFFGSDPQKNGMKEQLGDWARLLDHAEQP